MHMNRTQLFAHNDAQHLRGLMLRWSVCGESATDQPSSCAFVQWVSAVVGRAVAMLSLIRSAPRLSPSAVKAIMFLSRDGKFRRSRTVLRTMPAAARRPWPVTPLTDSFVLGGDLDPQEGLSSFAVGP